MKKIICAFFGINDQLRENSQNSVPIVFIASPIDVLCLNFVKFGRREIGKIVHCLPDKKTKLHLALRLSLLRVSPKKIYHGQPPTTYSDCARFHPNRFIFGGVISERVNTIKTGRKVFPVFG